MRCAAARPGLFSAYPEKNARKRPIPIIGIGASAGGVEALEGFFRAVPAESGLAYAVVTHLGSGHVSILPDIIGRFTSMPVAAMRDGAPMKADHVYVLPPDSIATIEGGNLRLRHTTAAHRERNPIDIFFAALGQDQGDCAIGVVLSGGGSDGTLGIKAIKAGGGLTVAQGSDGSHPRHASMPESAVASGLVDLVLPVQDIPAKLVAFARGLPLLAELVSEEDREADRATVARVAACQILRSRIGYDFSGYKPATMLRRIHRRMQVVQLDTLEGYIDRLRQDPQEVAKLFRDLLIGVTNFFRDAQAYEVLQRIIPRLFEGAARTMPCGSGSRAARPARRHTRSPFCCASTWTCSATRRASRSSRPTSTRRRSR